MSWFGKIIGGTLGFAIGGPLGALLGASLGHSFDRSAGSAADENPRLQSASNRLDSHEQTQTTFFTATFAVMGHLAKADGLVTHEEVRFAGRVMDEMQLTQAQRRFAQRLFNEGKTDDFPLDEILDQLRRECRYSTHLITMFVEILMHGAFADNNLHRGERALLQHICAQLHLPDGEFDRIEAMLRAEQHTQGISAADALSTDDAYAILGVEETCSDAELKRAYRRMMSRHHPDKLVAKGLPEEMMQLATKKTREIKAAYDRLKSVRGF